MKALVCNKISGSVGLTFLIFLFLVTNARGADFYSISAGDWESPSSWVTDACGGSATASSIPQAGDNVFICSAIILNSTVTVNNLTINNGGNLSFAASAISNLTVSGNIRVNTGGTFQAVAGTILHTLNLAGSFTNNGVVDFWKSTTSNVSLNFNGGRNSVVSGSGTWNLFAVTMNKTLRDSTFEVQAPAFFTNFNSGVWTLTQGTYFHNCNRTFDMASGTADYTINSNTIVRVGNGTLNIAAAGNELVLEGGLVITGGTVNVGRSNGTSPNSLRYRQSGGIPFIELSGTGLLNSYQGINSFADNNTSRFSFIMKGGTLTLNTGSSQSTRESFRVTDVSGSVFRMEGGTITLVRRTSGAGRSDFAVCGNSGTVSSTGGRVQFASSVAETFTFTPFANATLPNFEVVGGAGTNITLRPSGAGNFRLLSLYIGAGKTFDISATADVNDIRTMTLTGMNQDGYAFFDNNSETTDHFLYRQGRVEITSSSKIRTNAASDLSIRRFFNLSLAFTGRSVEIINDFGVSNILTINGGTIDAPLRNIYLYSGSPLLINNGSVITLSNLIFRGSGQDLPGYNYDCSIIAQGSGTQIKQKGKVTCYSLKITGPGASYTNVELDESMHVKDDIDIGCSSCGAAANADLGDGVLTVDGSFNLINYGSVNAGNATIYVGKDWNNTSTHPTGFNESQSTVIFTGTGKNQIKCTQCTALAPEVFFNLGIDKDGKDTLLTTVRVTNLLSFTKGYFISTSTNKMIVGSTGIVSGASDASFVDGPVQKVNAGTFDFPIGDSGSYKPLGISPGSTGSTFTAEYIKGPAPQPTYNFASKQPAVLEVSRCEYWNLTRDAGTNSTRVKLAYTSTSCGATEYATAKVTNWSSTLWIDLGRGGPNTSGNASGGFIENDVAVSTFGIFTLQSCPKPIVTVSGATNFCQGKSVTLTSNYPTTNVWAPGGQTTSSITVTTSGSYTVTATTTGCTATSAPVNVTVNPLPALPTAVTISPSTICDSAIVTLTATGSTDYKWYEDNITTTPLDSGPSYITSSKIKANRQFYVTSYDNNGCESSSRRPIFVNITNSPEVPIAEDKFICDPGEIVLTAGGSTGGYIWYDVLVGGSPVYYSSNFVIPNHTATKTYYVAASVSGCESARTKVVASLHSRPSNPIGIPDSICGNGSVTLKATGSSNGYKWYKADPGPVEATTASYTTESLSTTTTYYVSSMSPEGCESEGKTPVLAIVKKIPALPTAANGTNCGPGEVNLSVSGVTGSYKWFKDDSDPVVLSTSDTYNPNISTTTTYYVSSDSLSCLSSRIPVVATIFDRPALPSGSDVSRCGPGRVPLEVSASATSFKWYLDSTTTLVQETLPSYLTDSILTDTKYYVSSISSDGCESDGRTKISAIIKQLPSSPVVIDGDRCGPGSVNLEASGAGSEFIWYSEAINGDSLYTGTNYETESLTTTTRFYVLAKSVQGCYSSTRSEVIATVKPIPVPPVPVHGSKCGPGEVTISAGLVSGGPGSYKWFKDNTDLDVLSTSSSYVPNISTTTTFYVSTDSLSCSSNRVPVVATIFESPALPTGSDVSRCGPGRVTLEASASATSFKWYLDSTTTLVQGTLPSYLTDSILTDTKYYVSSISSDGCESDGRTKINAIINELPSPPTVKDGYHCGPGQVDLEASGSAKGFIWYSEDVSGDSLFSGEKYKTASLNSTTHFYVLAKDSLGCSSNDRTEVVATIKAIPATPVPVNNSNCGPGDVDLSATGSNDKYKWYASESGGTPLDSLATYIAKNLSDSQTFYVASQEDGCQSDRVEVEATIHPIPAKPVAVSDSSCGEGDLDLLASGASDYYWYSDALSTIKLDSGATFTAKDISTTQFFYVSAISDKGCESTDRTQVQALILDIPGQPTAADTALCGQGMVKLTASASSGTFRWYNTQNIEIGNQPEFQTGTINFDSIFYVSSIVSGCESIKKAVLITINPVPPAPVVKDTSRCGPGVINLSASGSPNVYRWYANENDDSSMALLVGNVFSPNITSTVSYYVSSLSDKTCESSEKIKVTAGVIKIPDAPTTDTFSRCGPGEVELSASSPSESYLWYTSANVLIGNIVTYKVNVTSDTIFYVASDSAGCISSKTMVEAIVKPFPVAPTAKDTATCVAGNITLAASGSPETYKWYDSNDNFLQDGQSILRNITQTSTFLVASSLNGCLSEIKTPLTVTLNSIPPNPETSVKPVCGEGRVGLTASGSVGNYFWYQDETTETPIVNDSNYLTDSLSVSTVFYVLAEKDNCKSPRIPVEAVVNPLPLAPSAIGDSVCGNGEVNLSASGNFNNYIWYATLIGDDSLDSGEALKVVLSSTTTYYVSSLDNNGCESASRTPVQAIVNPFPAKPAVVGDERCGAGPVILKAIGYDEYKWFETENGLPLSNTEDTLKLTSLAETKSYYVSSVSHGCTSQDKAEVIAKINPLPSKPLGVDSSVCGEGSVLLSAQNSPDKYYWYDDANAEIPLDTTTSDFLTPLLTSERKYYVSAVDLLGCVSEKEEVTASVKPLPGAPVTISDSICGVIGKMTLKAEGTADTYKWYSSDTSPIVLEEGPEFIINDLPVTTTYYVASETKGCTSSSRTIVTAMVKSQPDKPITINDTICGGGNVELRAMATGADSFVWFNGETILADENNNTLNVNVTNNTVFSVATIYKGCNSSEKTEVWAIVKPYPLLPEAKDGFSCGPGRVTLNATGTGKLLWYQSSLGGESIGEGGTIVTLSTLESDTLYYVTSEAQGCENSSRVKVLAEIKPKPVIPVTEDQKICGSKMVRLIASGAPADGEYLWFVPDSSEVKHSGAEYEFNAVATTTMHVAVGLDGCKSDRIPVTVRVDTIPALPVTADVSRCGAGKVKLQASGSTGQFNWYNGSQTIITTGTELDLSNQIASSSYFVSSYDENCESEKVEVKVTIDPESRAGSLESPATIVCNGENSGTITAVGIEGTVKAWLISGNNFLTATKELPGTTELNYYNIASSTGYKIIVQNGNCPADTSEAFILSVDSSPVTIGGTLLLEDSTSSGGMLKLEDFTGDIVRWEYSSDGITYAPMLNTDSIYKFSISSIHNFYRAVVKSGTCPERTSEAYYLGEFLKMRIYTSFSPNGDGFNDIWFIDGIEAFPDNKVSIFNRWGNLVYEASGYDNNIKVWKGTANTGMLIGNDNTLPDGTYFYNLDWGKGKKPSTGYVVIKR